MVMPKGHKVIRPPQRRVCKRGHKAWRGEPCAGCMKLYDERKQPCSESDCKNKVRKLGRACRACYTKHYISPQMVKVWRSQTYRVAQSTALRTRKPRRKDNGWLPTEEAVIREFAGVETPLEIARRCTAVSFIPRTAAAARARAALLGISLARAHWVRGDVAKLFGVDGMTVDGWLDGGMLEHRPWGPSGSWLRRCDEEQLRAFIRGYPWLFDYESMARGPFKALAETVQRRDPWWTTERARQETGLGASTLVQAVRRGWVVPRRRRGAHGGQLMFRARDLAGIQARVAEWYAEVKAIRMANITPGNARSQRKAA